ncbi:MAG: N-acetylmuramoyl-L-alanine amidase [Pseudomonadota bacterium]
MIAEFEPDSPCVNHLVPAVNIETRNHSGSPDILLMHYTGFDTAENAIKWLAIAESRVSCHYVIDLVGEVTQMVPEHLRAWHAGESEWHGATDINSRSIGIEIQNLGHERGYHDFPKPQMDAVARLARDIIARNGMRPERVLAHSDIAPHRKIDPGEKFDWSWLSTQGVGHWVAPTPVDALPAPGASSDSIMDVRAIQLMLRAYGYGLEITGEHDRRTRLVVAAFQRHFRPARVDGEIDFATADTLKRLMGALN